MSSSRLRLLTNPLRSAAFRRQRSALFLHNCHRRAKLGISVEVSSLQASQDEDNRP
jgi:hypothetical protein